VTRKTRGAVVAIASIAMIVAAAGAAFGFTDDANAGGTTFVTAANALQKAGCAAGFGDGSFGYNGTVTRGQDAIFQIACAPGIAYVNNSSAPLVALSGTAQTLSTVTFTAGINPGGLQYIQVRGVATIGGNPGQSLTPTISVSPPAGSTAASPTSVTCAPVLNPTNGLRVDAECEAGFTVPTGQALAITFSATGAGNAQPSTLAVNSAPRGNSASSGTLS
jgi:hypothetical protein